MLFRQPSRHLQIVRRRASGKFLFIRVAQTDHSEYSACMTAQRKNKDASCFYGVNFEPMGYFIAVILTQIEIFNGAKRAASTSGPKRSAKREEGEVGFNRPKTKQSMSGPKFRNKET